MRTFIITVVYGWVGGIIGAIGNAILILIISAILANTIGYNGNITNLLEAAIDGMFLGAITGGVTALDCRGLKGWARGIAAVGGLLYASFIFHPDHYRWIEFWVTSSTALIWIGCLIFWAGIDLIRRKSTP